MKMNRSSTIRSAFGDPPVIHVEIPCPKHHETPYQLVLRQFGTLFGFLSRIVFVAIFLTYFYFGRAYFLMAVPLLVALSMCGVLLAFRFKDWRFFMFIMSVEVISALSLMIIGFFLLVESLVEPSSDPLTNYPTHSSLLTNFELRDVRPVCALLLIYPPMQMSFLYVLYRGYQDYPLFPDFKPVVNDKSTRRAMCCYRTQKYLILIVLILLLVLWAVLTSRLASLAQCGKPCPQADSFFMGANRNIELQKSNGNENLENVTYSFRSEEVYEAEEQ